MSPPSLLRGALVLVAIVAFSASTLAAEETTIEINENGDLSISSTGEIVFHENGRSISLTELENNTLVGINALQGLQEKFTAQLQEYDGKFAALTAYVDAKLKELAVNVSNELASDDVVSALEAKLDNNLDSLMDTIEAESRGYCDGNSFKAWINGEEVEFDLPKQRGINAFHLNLFESPPTVVAKENFDTCCTSETTNPAVESGRLVLFINGLDKGEVVVFGIDDEGTMGLSDAAIDALESMGVAMIRDLSSRESWVAIGVKGAVPGTIPEDNGGGGPRPVNENCPLNHRPTRKVRQDFFGGALAALNSETVRSKLREQQVVSNRFAQVEEGLEALDDLAETIESQSQAYCNGARSSKIWINGELHEYSDSARGINAFKFDLSSHPVDIVEARNFDTHGFTSASDDLVAYLDAMATGTVVVFSVSDSAADKLTEAARATLEKFGSKYIRSVSRRESWTMVGIKGAIPGTVAEDYAPDEGTTCSGAGGPPTKKIKQTVFGGHLVAMNSETVMARLRDQAGLVTLATATGDLSTRVETLEGTSDSVVSRMDAVEPKVDANEQALEDLILEHVVAQAAGWCNGNFFKVWLNGVAQTVTQSRGINTFILTTTAPLQAGTARNFDTHDQAGAADALEAYLNGLPDGTVAVFGLVDAGTDKLDQAARTSIKAFGSTLIDTLAFRQGWVMIGVKGAGSVIEAVDKGGDCGSLNGYNTPSEKIGQYFLAGRIAGSGV